MGDLRDTYRMRVSILGTRGSVPVCGGSYTTFGGATSCIKVQLEDFEGRTFTDEEIYLDAGSGIVLSDTRPESHVSILFSHMHLDHLIGLPFFMGLSQKGKKIDLYGMDRSGVNIDEAMVRLFSPPFWPLKITDYPADTSMHGVEESFDIGKIHVDALEINHPGGCTSFKLSLGNVSLVYLTDFEHTGADLDRIKDFFKNADLLIYDGQYTGDEYPGCKGFGHSIPEFGLELARGNGVKKILYTHHAPNHDDEFLKGWEKDIKKKWDAASFARAGESILL